MRTGYKTQITDYVGKTSANWLWVRKDKSKRLLNSKTREFKLLSYKLLEIPGGGVHPGSLNHEPDKNAIFYTRFFQS